MASEEANMAAIINDTIKFVYESYDLTISKAIACSCGTESQIAKPAKATCSSSECPCFAKKEACKDCICGSCNNPYAAQQISSSSSQLEKEVRRNGGDILSENNATTSQDLNEPILQSNSSENSSLNSSAASNEDLLLFDPHHPTILYVQDVSQSLINSISNIHEMNMDAYGETDMNGS